MPFFIVRRELWSSDKIVAHGATVGLLAKKIKPRMGRQKTTGGNFFRPIRGLIRPVIFPHGFTVGYYRPLLRSF